MGYGWPMRTVADLMSAEASLAVRCMECGHEGYLSARLLKARLGFTGQLQAAGFRCSRCRCERVQLGLAAPTAADRPLGPMQYFGGIYEKFRDD